MKAIQRYFWRYVAVVRASQPMLFLLAGLLLSALMLVLFINLASETITERELDQLDVRIIGLVRMKSGPVMDTLMIWFSALGTGFIYIVCLPVLLVVLGRKRLWRETAVVAVCLSGGVVLNYLLKELFQRARPEMFRVVDAAGYSFPSGHAMVSLCFYGMVGYVAFLHAPGWRRWIIAVATIVIFLVGISRIYLGVHYPTDVLAGYLAGSTWLAFCVALLAWWDLKAPRGRK